MMKQALHITLQEDCVFSARSATEGGHASLDHIPGSVLLGAAASRLYTRLGGRAFDVFHSGRLRFGDGLPLAANGAVAWPVPLSWHHDKTAEVKEADGRLRAEAVANFQYFDRLSGDRPLQPKQMREGYVTACGSWLKPHRDFRLKTAIDPETGRAAEGQLFGYDALHRGQAFLASIEAAPDFDADLFQQVVEALSGELLIGRSRSAEYGRVRICCIDDPGGIRQAGEGDWLTLWLLSDLALLDGYGQPLLQPSAESFGIPGGRISWDRTFLRTRRYSPWNSARGGHDRERLVLCAGGVITIELPAGIDRAEVAERLNGGVGQYQEAGLGKIWVDPPLLASVRPQFDESSEVPDNAEPEKPDHPLVDWLLTQNQDWKTRAEEAVEDFLRRYRNLLLTARRFRGIALEADFGPSKSQWATVQAAARAAKGEILRQALFEGADAIIKPNGEGWNIEIKDGEDYLKLAQWLGQELSPDSGALELVAESHRARAYAHFVRMAARRIQDEINKRSL